MLSQGRRSKQHTFPSFLLLRSLKNSHALLAQLPSPPLSPEKETCLDVPLGLRQMVAEKLASPRRPPRGPAPPHLPLLPPRKAGSITMPELRTGQPPPSSSASPSSQWPLCWGPYPRAGRARESTWCGTHLPDGELVGGRGKTYPRS